MTTLEFLRQYRLGGYAIFDFVVSFGGIYFLSPILSKICQKFEVEVPKQNWLFLTLPIGIILHLLTGTMTPMTKDFIDVHNHYILKICVLSLLVLGIKGIRKTR